MSRIRLGLIGAGAIAGLTAREFKTHPAADIVAVADLNSERAGALAQSTGAERVYSDSAELIANPDIDAVYIAVPNIHHEAIACAALAALIWMDAELRIPSAVALGAALAIALLRPGFEDSAYGTNGVQRGWFARRDHHDRTSAE